MRASSRKLLVVLLGLCVLGFVIYRSSGFIHLADFSGAKLLHAVRGANPYYLILSLAAIYGCYALRALRWEVFNVTNSTRFDFNDQNSSSASESNNSIAVPNFGNYTHLMTNPRVMQFALRYEF